MITAIRKLDGRWFLGGSHLFLFLISYFVIGIFRSPEQVLYGYISAFIVELLLFYSTNKYKDKSIWDRLFSAATEAAGLIILVRSADPYFYAVTSALAVSSKYFLRWNDKNHLFNPTNFAICLSMCIFEKTSFNLLADEYSVSLYPMIHVFIFGMFAIYLGKTWPVTLSYILTILVFSLIMLVDHKGGFLYWFAPEVGAIGLIFMFLMITDPKTTPNSLSGMLFYGFMVAVFKIIFKAQEIIYPQYLALFIVTFSRGVYIYLEEEFAILKKWNPFNKGKMIKSV